MFAKLTAGAAARAGKHFVEGRYRRRRDLGLSRSWRVKPRHGRSLFRMALPTELIQLQGERLGRYAKPSVSSAWQADWSRLCVLDSFRQWLTHDSDADKSAGVCDKPVVITENLSSDHSIATAELAAIETYLADMLDELLGPAIAPPFSPIS